MRPTRPKLCMLRRATRKACRDLSIATPDEFGIFFTREHIMQPVPVPRSRIRGDCVFIGSFITDDTNVSVSGRGSSVCLFV